MAMFATGVFFLYIVAAIGKGLLTVKSLVNLQCFDWVGLAWVYTEFSTNYEQISAVTHAPMATWSSSHKEESF